MAEDGKTEVEFAGVKFRGGKIFIIVTALTTLGGGLFAGFEFYKDYMNMRNKIERYTAPDLSGFDKKLAVLREQMSTLEAQTNTLQKYSEDARTYTKETKNDLKSELALMEKQVDDIERRGKESFRMVRDSIETNDAKVRKLVTTATDRFDTRREQLRREMENLEKTLKDAQKTLESRINKTIEKTLKNPLSQLRGQ
jgi:DNA repair exonuclease SbcCD ATPase subunit